MVRVDRHCVSPCVEHWNVAMWYCVVLGPSLVCPSLSHGGAGVLQVAGGEVPDGGGGRGGGRAGGD